MELQPGATSLSEQPPAPVLTGIIVLPDWHNTSVLLCKSMEKPLGAWLGQSCSCQCPRDALGTP